MDQDNIYFSKSEMSLNTKRTPLVSNRTSEHNVYMTYVCLVKDGMSRNSNIDRNEITTDVEDENDIEPIQVERSKAVHELVESIKNHNIIKTKPTNTFTEESETSDQDDDDNKYNNSKILKLTKMKWLSENQNGYPNSSSPSVSSAHSTTSSKAGESDEDSGNRPDIGEKYLSTILRLDKEHNLFGLSSIAIIGSKQSRPKSRKDDERPVFHQTAIVQVCKTCCASPCCKPCCKNKSNTDLPGSLKYSGCGTCASCGSCASCPQPCFSAPAPPCPPPPQPSCLPTCLPPPCVSPPSCAMIPRNPKIHASCLPDTPKLKLTCFERGPCKDKKEVSPPPPPPPPCCNKPPVCTCGLAAFVPADPPQCCYGLRIKTNKKPNYKPAPHEITPRCTSELQKDFGYLMERTSMLYPGPPLPLMARTCTHNPCCQPPSATFPYLMPCYWPCRPSAPCLDPTQCFHHPPCMAPRRPKGFVPISQECVKHGPCKDIYGNKKCENKSCLGKNKEFQKGLEAWGKLGVPCPIKSHDYEDRQHEPPPVLQKPPPEHQEKPGLHEKPGQKGHKDDHKTPHAHPADKTGDHKSDKITPIIKKEGDNKKPDNKKPDNKKPDVKKPDDKKPDDKKTDDKKPDDKKPEDKKPDDKKSDTKKPGGKRPKNK